ncbi:MAG: CDP-alcohol phosphatidyltransferase family protein [Chloroflexi bacterium]|nr:CDP-alcohol phosphatidyltransferase family protein [Chloroflexota bacterium]
MTLREQLRTSLSRLFEEPAAHFLRRLHVPPNAVTLLGLGVTAGAGHLASRGHFLWAGVALLFASAMDMLDGTLARLTGKASPFGAALDSVADRLAEAIILLGVQMHYIRTGDNAIAYLAFGAMVASFMVSYIRARGEGLGVTMKESGLFTRTERVIVMVAGLLTGWVPAALAIIFLTSLFSALQRMYHLWKATQK